MYRMLKKLIIKESGVIDETILGGKYAKQLDNALDDILRTISKIVEKLYDKEDMEFKARQLLFLTMQMISKLSYKCNNIVMEIILESSEAELKALELEDFGESGKDSQN